MRNQREDNTVAVVQRAIRHYNIRVTSNTVKDTLKSSLYYPTFKSICDSLSEWKVEHYPLKYNPEEIKKLKSPYITHFNSGKGQIAFVSGYKNGCVVYYDSYHSKKKIEWDEYVKKISGAIILLNPDKNSGERNYGKKFQEELLNKLIIPAIIWIVALIVSVLIINNTLFPTLQISWQYVLLFTKFIGIFLSALLLMKEYEIYMPLTEKLCHISRTINCNSVLNDKRAMAFGTIGWADIGMIYFMGSLLIILQSSFTRWNGYLIAASMLSLPFIIFSVWYQGHKLKKWCPFCIMVQVVLVAEFLFQLSFLHVADFSLTVLSIFVLTFLTVGVLHVLINLYIRESRIAKFNYRRLEKFKRNPEIFRTLLFSQKHYDIKITAKSLLFGKLNSDLQISAFLSLNCSHCAVAFTKVVEFLRCESNVQVNLVLSGGDNKIIDTLFHHQRIGNENGALILLDQWYKSDQLAKSSFQEEYCMIDATEVSREIIFENHNIMKDCGITTTPTFFINGYKLPHQYGIEDITFFREFLKSI